MPSYLDLALIGVVLISALLSMLRGFTRELLAIASWAAAAFAAYKFYPLVIPYLKPYISKEGIQQAVAAGAVFIGTLIVVSIITVRISDKILDSRAGALDRSLGFLFGAGRGYLLFAIAFIFFAWLVPEKNYPTWVQNSKTRSWLEATGAWMQALLPENLDSSLTKILKKQKGDEPPAEGDGDKAVPAAPTPPARPVQQRGEAPAPGLPSQAAAPGRPSQAAAAPARAQPPQTQSPQTIDALIQQTSPQPRR